MIYRVMWKGLVWGLLLAVGGLLAACGAPAPVPEAAPVVERGTTKGLARVEPGAEPDAQPEAEPEAQPEAQPEAEPEADEGPDVVEIPGACFQMGYDRGDHDERPRHEVCVSQFFIDRVEVSNARYEECVEAGVCRAATRYPRRPELSLPDRPVVGVGWVDGDRYCRWVGRRLPTDAEWELAAGGTDGRRFPWGDEPPSCERAVYAHCPPHSTVPVDSYPEGASPYGVLHMGGNAWEWVWDWWSSAYYRQSPRQDPRGPERGGMRSIRGGCWNRTPWHVRVADRDSGVVNLRNNHVGFRCACTSCGTISSTP